MSDDNAPKGELPPVDLIREEDFELGALQVRPSRLRVEGSGWSESLERRIMQVLVVLAQARGATVSREALIARCWEGRIVGEPAIQRCISRLRRLAESPGGPHFQLENVPRLGYRLLVAPPSGAASRAEPERGEVARKLPPRRALRYRRAAALVLMVLAVGLLAAAAAWLLGRQERTPLIAVLPFADLSAARDQAYFAEGVSEEILGVLAEEPGLRIIGRTSAARFKSAADLDALRRVLGVSHVLEGSVRGGAAQVRVNVRLLRSSDGVEVWSERYQRPATDIFALQDEIGASVVRQLRGALNAGKAQRKTPTYDVRAYDLYLAGRAHLRRRDRASVTTARSLFTRAIEIAPAYAPAYGALAEATRLLADDRLGDIPAAQARAEAERLAQTAIRLAPGAADGYAALGFARTYEAASLEPLERAVRLAPARPDVRIWLAGGYQQAGRFDDAFRQYEAAYAVEPLWQFAVFNRVDTLSTRREFDQAEQVVRRYEAFTEAPGQAAWLRGMIAEKRGDLSEAVRQARMAQRLDPDLSDNSERLAWAYGMLGLRDHAAAALPKNTRPLQRHIASGRRREAAALAASLGPQFWADRATGWRAAEVLAAERRWRELVRLYDARFNSPQAFCAYAAGTWAGLGVPFVVALREVGRAADADTILQCTAVGVDAWVRSGGHPQSAWFYQAEVAALRGDRSAALDALERALAANWQGEHVSADFSHYPALAALTEEPRFRAARDRVQGYLRRERREVDALLASDR